MPHGHEEAMPAWAVDLVRWTRSPLFAGTVFTGALALAGLVLVVVSGLEIGDYEFVALQVPFLVSGGFGAVGLLLTGAVIASILGHRRDAAEADRQFGEVTAEVVEIARLAREVRP